MPEHTKIIGILKDVQHHVDLRDRSVTVPDAIPASARTEAQEKGQRVLDLLLAARAKRRRGARAPVTAHQRWQAEGGQP